MSMVRRDDSALEIFALLWVAMVGISLDALSRCMSKRIRDTLPRLVGID